MNDPGGGVKNQVKIRILAALIAGIAALAGSGSALASGGGFGGGGHGGGGHGGGGGGGGHFGGGGHSAGGRAGFAGHGGYGGYRGGWGYGGWGWGGLGLGLYFATLPYYYSTFWADGMPYYYADDNYYQWDGAVGEYQTVNPPADIRRQASEQSPDLMAYPKNGQTTEQQATDKSDCRVWAVGQTGIDPTQVATAQVAAIGSNRRSDFMRAQAACLEGRGYSVK
jgi:hypothetical protein